MDQTTTPKETAIIELETLTPLFIKGKDPDYGEGSYLIGNKAYILDNDKLCKFIYDKTYDKDGKLLVEGQDYVVLYRDFLVRNEDGNDLRPYNAFAERIGLQPVEENKRVPKEFKKRSAKFFLQETKLMPQNQSTEEKVVRDMAKGITYVSKAKRGFIVDGCGNPYIPGSSIKGAIRNALLWEMLKADRKKGPFTSFVQEKFQWCETGKLKKRKFAASFSRKDDDAPTPLAKASLDSLTLADFSPKFAGDKTKVTEGYIEKYNQHWKKASDIHRDLSRIIKITDANFIGGAALKKIDIATYNLKGAIFKKRENTDAKLEAADIAKKAWFRITLDLDLAREFFGGKVPPYLASIEALLKTVSDFFYAVAKEELDFYKKSSNSGPVHKVKKCYEALLRSAEIEGQEKPLLFRLGWGGGMMTKTQFLHLDEKDRKRSRDLMNPRNETVAPQSRCLQVSENEAFRPLGWCTLRYLGSNIAEAEDASAKADAERKAKAPAPLGCVRATIVDNKSFPIKIRIKDGENQDAVVDMTRIKPQQLQNLGLQNNSVVFVVLIEQRGKKGKRVISATYRDKP